MKLLQLFEHFFNLFHIIWFTGDITPLLPHGVDGPVAIGADGQLLQAGLMVPIHMQLDRLPFSQLMDMMGKFVDFLRPFSHWACIFSWENYVNF